MRCAVFPRSPVVFGLGRVDVIVLLPLLEGASASPTVPATPARSLSARRSFHLTFELWVLSFDVSGVGPLAKGSS